MHYQGSCHCGAISFGVEGTLDSAMGCNCSMCARKGALLWFVPRTALQLQAEPDAIGTYTFNRHVIKHNFCKTCGIHTHGEGAMPDGTPMAAINVRCLEGVELERLAIKHYDGRSA